MKTVFLDAETVGKDVSLSALESSGQLVCYDATLPEDIVSRIKDADVVISNKVVIGEMEMSAAPNLKLICVAATGTNNIDKEAASRHGIVVRNVVNYSTESVAQVTFMQILQLVGHSSYFDHFVKSGLYSRSACFTNVVQPFFELKGKRLGIIGLGNIGQRVAKLAKSFGMDVVYHPTSGKAHSDEYQALPLDELLKSCDIVSIHAPLNECTEHLIDYSKLALMKPSAYILNMGRGGIIVEEDLVRALNEDLVAGAAVDVYTKEPFEANHPYSDIRNPEKILFTPHIAWASLEARKVLIEKTAENIRQFFSSCGQTNG